MVSYLISKANLKHFFSEPLNYQMQQPSPLLRRIYLQSTAVLKL